MCHRKPGRPGHLPGDVCWNRASYYNRILGLELVTVGCGNWLLACWPVLVSLCLGHSISRPLRSSSGSARPAPIQPREVAITPRKYRYLLAQAMSGNFRPRRPASAGRTSGQLPWFAVAAQFWGQDQRGRNHDSIPQLRQSSRSRKLAMSLIGKGQVLCKCRSIDVPLSVRRAVHREKGLGIGESFAATLGGMQRRRNMYALSPNSFLSIPRSQPRWINIAGFQI